ncbi:hypothetical protein DFH27DRAFT_572570 [Peziza echinospora]|nr:hypothetical protein DFH27DRAFT_572570 [Peziza echinospora]
MTSEVDFRHCYLRLWYCCNWYFPTMFLTLVQNCIWILIEYVIEELDVKASKVLGPQMSISHQISSYLLTYFLILPRCLFRA